MAGTPGLQKFSFIKMSAITHSVNTDLRYLSLPFTEVSPGTYEITAHSSLNVMTPGYWMLFGLNAAGAHSVAKIILVDAISSVGVVIPGNQASYVGQAASLQMIGSGPAGSVLTLVGHRLPNGTHYQLRHRPDLRHADGAGRILRARHRDGRHHLRLRGFHLDDSAGHVQPELHDLYGR